MNWRFWEKHESTGTLQETKAECTCHNRDIEPRCEHDFAKVKPLFTDKQIRAVMPEWVNDDGKLEPATHCRDFLTHLIMCYPLFDSVCVKCGEEERLLSHHVAGCIRDALTEKHEAHTEAAKTERAELLVKHRKMGL